MSTLLEELTTGLLAEQLAPLIAVRNDVAIAELLNTGRTKLIKTEIGYLTILRELGLESGNNLLDAITSNTLFRYVKPGLEIGTLDVSDALVRITLDQLAISSVITQLEADKLKNLAIVPDIIAISTISDTLNLLESSQ